MQRAQLKIGYFRCPKIRLFWLFSVKKKRKFTLFLIRDKLFLFLTRGNLFYYLIIKEKSLLLNKKRLSLVKRDKFNSLLFKEN